MVGNPNLTVKTNIGIRNPKSSLDSEDDGLSKCGQSG